MSSVGLSHPDPSPNFQHYCTEKGTDLEWPTGANRGSQKCLCNCTPGMLLAAHQLLGVKNDPSDAEIRLALSGNLCRCTGYVKIVQAVHDAATRLASREVRSHE